MFRQNILLKLAVWLLSFALASFVVISLFVDAIKADSLEVYENSDGTVTISVSLDTNDDPIEKVSYTVEALDGSFNYYDDETVTSNNLYSYRGTFTTPPLDPGEYRFTAAAHTENGESSWSPAPVIITGGDSHASVSSAVNRPWDDGRAVIFQAAVNSFSPSSVTSSAVISGFIYSQYQYQGGQTTYDYFLSGDYDSWEMGTFSGTFDIYTGTIDAQVPVSIFEPGKTYYIWAYYDNHRSDGALSFSDLPLEYNNEIEAPMHTPSPSMSYGDKPAVRTDTVYTIGGMAGARGTVVNMGSGPFRDYGFIYSDSSPNPVREDVNNVSMIPFATSDNPNLDKDFSYQFKPSGSGIGRYYIRAYAINDMGISYGDTFTVTIQPNTNIAIGGFAMGHSDIEASVFVNGIVSANISEAGIIYTDRPDVNPTLTLGFDYARADVNGSDITASIKNFKPETAYYLRPYLKKTDGSYVYGDIVQVETQARPKLSIFRPVNIEPDHISIGGEYFDLNGGSAETGFVYSNTDRNPTISGMSVKSPNFGESRFSSEITGLNPDTAYFFRAYAKTGASDYIYSNAIEVKTTRGTAAVSINYVDADGVVIGTEPNHIYRDPGRIITEANLTVPGGYVLYDREWSYTVTESAAIEVRIKAEQPYMEGIGRYMFGPDNDGTVMETASMLYSVLADPNITYSSPSRFPDVDYSDPRTANIVNFVSSSGYMVGNNLGLFRPDDPISRAEAAAIICEVKALADKYTGPTPIPSRFVDTPLSYWGSGYITLAANDGAFGGFPDGTFRPFEYVTKAQLAVIFGSAFGRSDVPLGDRDFADVPQDHWAYTFIMNAAIPER